MKTIIVLFFIMTVLLTKAIHDHSDHVISHTRDERGLTSVIFQQDGKVWGMDYLTSSQVDSLNKVLHQK